MADYFTQLKLIHPKDLVRIYESKVHLPLLKIWELTNEIKPIDLYCYLHAKYGPPNGIQNFLRNDDSDNLIHWEWTLANDDGLLTVQGHNFRTEVHLFRKMGADLELDDLVEQTKRDFSNFGKQIKAVRTQLEKWTHFVNPYQRIRAVLDQHIRTLSDLDLDPDRDRKPHPKTTDEVQTFAEDWEPLARKYTQALGLAFGVRAMLPVLAESFINFLIFALARPEIRSNKRLLQETLRRPIDARVQTLHLNCRGFEKPVDYQHTACKKFHTIMNERNDTLHGNIDLERLSFEEIYFNGRVPIFTSYGSFWDKTIGLEARTVRLTEIQSDMTAVNEFIEYVLGLLAEEFRKTVQYMLRSPQLGFDKKREIIGVLLPMHMVDGRAGAAEEPPA